MRQYKISYEIHNYTVNQDIPVVHASWIILVSTLQLKKSPFRVCNSICRILI